MAGRPRTQSLQWLDVHKHRAYNGLTSMNTEQSTQWLDVHKHRAHNGWTSTNTEHCRQPGGR